MQRLSEIDITNYVLNELEPSERLFVESLMLGCEASRSDALAMMETTRVSMMMMVMMMMMTVMMMMMVMMIIVIWLQSLLLSLL